MSWSTVVFPAPIPPPIRRRTGLLSLCATGAITSVHCESSVIIILIAFSSSTNVVNTLATFRFFVTLWNLCSLHQEEGGKKGKIKEVWVIYFCRKLCSYNKDDNWKVILSPFQHFLGHFSGYIVGPEFTFTCALWLLPCDDDCLPHRFITLCRAIFSLKEMQWLERRGSAIKMAKQQFWGKSMITWLSVSFLLCSTLVLTSSLLFVPMLPTIWLRNDGDGRIWETLSCIIYILFPCSVIHISVTLIEKFMKVTLVKWWPPCCCHDNALELPFGVSIRTQHLELCSTVRKHYIRRELYCCIWCLKIITTWYFIEQLDLGYLTNHKISIAPMECKVTKNASLKLLNKLHEEWISVLFAWKECINIFLTTFRFPNIIRS